MGTIILILTLSCLALPPFFAKVSSILCVLCSFVWGRATPQTIHASSTRRHEYQIPCNPIHVWLSSLLIYAGVYIGLCRAIYTSLL